METWCTEGLHEKQGMWFVHVMLLGQCFTRTVFTKEDAEALVRVLKTCEFSWVES